MKPLLLLFAIVLFCSCGSDTEESRHDSIEASKDSLRTIADRKDTQKQCCFQSAEECNQFLPDTCAGYIKVSSAFQPFCDSDTLAHNYATVDYRYKDGHIISVRLTEYCTMPDMLASDYSMKYEMHRTGGEFNEFDVPPTHHGLNSFNNKTSTAYLVVEVDGRFLVEITDQVCENTKGTVAIYEALPLKELAGFGR